MTKAQREAIRKRLARITERDNGVLTPDAVVRDARNEASPLHKCFTWDDTEAAAKWRLHEARELIASVRVEIRTEQREVSTVCYVRDPSASRETQGYVQVAKLRTERQAALEALSAEMDAVQARIERAKSLADALDLSEDFERLRDQVIYFNERMKKAA